MVKESTVATVALGQLLSLALTLSGYFSSQIVKKGINAPFSQSFWYYVLIAWAFGGIIIHRKQVEADLYYRIKTALVDVIARLVVIEAFQYTSLTSVLLLDWCWIIPCEMFLICLFFKAKYGIQIFHQQKLVLVGVAICVVGMVTVVFSDTHAIDRSSSINPVKGDLLVILGGTLLSISLSIRDALFIRDDLVEHWFFRGIFGAILTGPQILIFERNEFKSIFTTPGAIFLFIGYALAWFLLLLGHIFLVEISGKLTILTEHTTLLTSSMWSVLIRISLYHEKVDWIYFVGFATVILGHIVCSRENKIDKEVLQLIEETSLMMSSSYARLPENDVK